MTNLVIWTRSSDIGDAMPRFHRPVRLTGLRLYTSWMDTERGSGRTARGCRPGLCSATANRAELATSLLFRSASHEDWETDLDDCGDPFNYFVVTRCISAADEFRRTCWGAATPKWGD